MLIGFSIQPTITPESEAGYYVNKASLYFGNILKDSEEPQGARAEIGFNKFTKEVCHYLYHWAHCGKKLFGHHFLAIKNLSSVI